MSNLKQMKNSLGYALEGLAYSFKHNQNIKIHIAIAVLVLLFAYLLGLDKYEFFIVSFLVVLVLSAEMINTSIEEVVNLLVNEHRIEAKTAKDVSAGMVLLISILALVVGLFVFTPHILKLLK